MPSNDAVGFTSLDAVTRTFHFILSLQRFTLARRVVQTPDYLAVRATFGVPQVALGSAIASPGPHGPTTGGGGYV